MTKFFLLSFLFFSLSVSAASSSGKLLNKTLAVVDDKVFTLAYVQRVLNTLPARNKMAGMIYTKSNLSQEEILEILVRRMLIRSRLSEIGIVVSDDRVESRLKERERLQHITRPQLLQFLKNENFSFEEYFELMREAEEFSYFNQVVIQPLISITEQEVKNTFYRKNANDKTLSFRYALVDFSLSKQDYKPSMKEEFKEALLRFQADGHLPEKYRNLDTTDLGDVGEDGLSSSLRELLKKTDEGAFSDPIYMNDRYHVFFVKKKDLIESQVFQEKKDEIREDLYRDLSEKMIDVWTQREKNKHYVRIF